MALKNDLKALLAKTGFTMTAIVCELNKRHNTDTTLQNFSSKVNRGTLKYSEVEEILDIIGYTIEWTERSPLK